MSDVKEMPEFEQWCRDRFTLSVDDLFERYEKLVAHYEAMALRHGEQALHDDQSWRERDALKQSMIRDGFQLFKQMVPSVINEILKKPNAKAEDIDINGSKLAESVESRLLVSFLDTLSKEQADKLFGDRGIFTPTQWVILLDVAQCKQPASAFDALFDGPNKVTQEQALALQAELLPEQWMPLMEFVMEKANEMSKRWQPREYTAEAEVPANGDVQLEFGVEVSVPGSGVVGLPETVEKIVGIEKDFDLQALVVDEEDAPHLSVIGVYLGASGLWRDGLEIAAQRFTVSAVPSVRFSKRMTAGYMIVMRVANKTDVPRRIRVKIVGRERT